MSEQISAELQVKIDAAAKLLQEASNSYEGNLSLANSLGVEDMVLTDLIAKHSPTIGMFVLDTGRLPEETLELLEKTKNAYPNVETTVYYPEAADVEAYVSENGINGFYKGQDERKSCCFVRKIKPLKRALADKAAWITGLRREQSVTRDEIQLSEWDDANQLYKLNPLADWTEKDVWTYVKALQVPYNALHDRHYPSIGCAPCTRAISVGEDVRAGRWWWENPENKECGLHPATPLNFK